MEFHDILTVTETMPKPDPDALLSLGVLDMDGDEQLFAEGRPTQTYIQIQALYRLFVTGMILSKTGLDRLDKRLAERGYLSVPDDRQDFFQKYDAAGLQYFFLLSFIHVERLSDEERAAFIHFLTEPSETAASEIAAKVEASFRKVLAIDPDHPEQMIELYPRVDASGCFRGGDILLALRTYPEYDEKGMLLDAEKDRRRINDCKYAAQRLEPICSKALNCSIRVDVEV